MRQFGHKFRAAIACASVVCAVISQTSWAQLDRQDTAGQKAKEVADALAKVKSPQFKAFHAEILAEARAVQAIPDLEKQFSAMTDPLDKAKIAQVLLFLGDRKDAYWEYLAQLAKPVLESDMPNPIQYDFDGKQSPGLTQGFVAWADSHNIPPGEAGMNAIYVWPGVIKLLGATNDTRAVPLLRRAFSSANPLVQVAASRGLAEAQDADSVPSIIEKCKNAPSDLARQFAESLVYFDDPAAQNAVDTYVPRDRAKMLRNYRMAGGRALHR